MKIHNEIPVANIVDGEIKVMKVPDGWKRCEISGEYRPREEFMTKEGYFRDMCVRIANLPKEEVEKIRRETHTLMKSVAYEKAYGEAISRLRLMANSVSVSEMMNALSKLNPNDRLVVTEEGYYSESPLAEIFLPLRTHGECYYRHKTEDGHEYYAIGHSCQNY